MDRGRAQIGRRPPTQAASTDEPLSFIEQCVAEALADLLVADLARDHERLHGAVPSAIDHSDTPDVS